MDAYCYALSTIKKLGYICDTLLYLTDFQPQLFLRRFDLQHITNEAQQTDLLRLIFFVKSSNTTIFIFLLTNIPCAYSRFL